jgi:methenyltetrahydromethanopterin cyclohydrolase
MDTQVATRSLRLNERAVAIAARMVDEADALGITRTRVGDGTTVIDCGIGANGGLEAGRLLAEITMGGLGRVDFTEVRFDGFRLPGVQVRTDHPAIACLASQYAGWAIRPERYFAMGSGPLRAVARVETELFGRLEYAEGADGPGVLALEGRDPPDERVASYIAGKAGITPDRLVLLIAPTASLAGGVQVSARVVETALHKMMELGFDVRRVVSGFGTAPIAPVAKDDLRAIGRTNDCVLYGGTVHLMVRGDDEELADLVARVPSSSSRDYGTPFHELFESYGGDFYKVDPHLFSPAEVYVTNLESGRTFHAGGTNAEVLQRSLFE